MCIEDFIDALEWSKNIGGLAKLIDLSQSNLNIIKKWVSKNNWIEFLSEKKETISSTSVCLKFSEEVTSKLDILDLNKLEKNMVNLLDKENIAYDIGSYRSAPPGFRIWCGPTIENKDLINLLPWLDWAFRVSANEIIGDQ